MSRTPYFKPTRKVHETGHKMIEFGYCDVDKKSNAINIKIVSNYDIFFDFKNPISHFDVTKNGYIRILSPELKWESNGGRFNETSNVG